MKLGKLLLVAVGASALLGALVSSASARSLEVSSQTTTALWTALRFAGGFGTIECEIRVSGSFHGRTSAKAVNSLSGYITEAVVLRCRTGGATINQASFPWHRRFRGFTGTLPNITGTSDTITGAEWSIREPVFGVTCTVRRESSSVIGTYTISSGTVTRAEVSGTSPCSGFSGTLSGSTTNVTEGRGARITVRLI